MREIKFRAWHKISEEMFVDYKPGQVFLWQDQGQPIEIMQYTGLKYNRGQDAYEGDIFFDAHSEEFGVIVFSNGCFYALVDRSYHSLSDVLSEYHVSHRGNIHENAELLAK